MIKQLLLIAAAVAPVTAINATRTATMSESLESGTVLDCQKIVNESDADVLWQGEFKLDNWDGLGVGIDKSKVKAGDILVYHFTGGDPSIGQCLIKNSGWGILLGTTNINVDDIAKGEVSVGVTDEMIENCGDGIYVQGAGGATIVKVTKSSETFNPQGIIAYGSSRSPNVNVYTQIPEAKTKISVEFETAPEWVNICKGDWTNLELASEGDGNVRTFTLTNAAISAINENKEFLIHTPVPVVKVYYPDAMTGAALYIIDNSRKTNVYDISGRMIRNNVDIVNATEGLPGGIYIINHKKVLVK